MPALLERLWMYSLSCSSDVLSSRLPTYTADFLSVGFDLVTRDHRSSSSSSGRGCTSFRATGTSDGGFRAGFECGRVSEVVAGLAGEG